MPDFDDVNQPPHFRPQLEYSMSIIDRYTVLLKDGETTATIYPIHSAEELPPGLLAFLCDEFNMEVDRGDTFPFFDTLHIETFQNYWFGSFAAVMVLGDVPTLDRPKQWEKECLGTFYIKPNYPGRCSHICTAGFLVNAGIRGKGIGRTLAECYLEWAPRLGYTYSIFNLVFDTNELAKKIWDSLGFKVIGKIKSAGILKGHDQAIDASIYGRELMLNTDPTAGSFRFERIRYYLETGKYPKNLDRQEKSRLRSSASHYRLTDGKLMLKGREVIADPTKQLEIATLYHQVGHPGINKSTASILEKYHWSRIKDTVAIVIRDCDECRLQKGLVLKRPNSYHAKIPRPDAISKADLISSRFPKQILKAPRLPSSSHKDNNDLHHLSNFNHLNSQGTSSGSHHHSSVDQSLLSTEFDADDPSGILAAVEAAQRSHSQLNNTKTSKQNNQKHSGNQVLHDDDHHHHHHHLQELQQDQQHYAYDGDHENGDHHHHEDDDHFTYGNNDEIDSDVISRALIQANEGSGNESDDEADNNEHVM